ncbi:MAG: hypothetical protein KYX64_11155 [Sphingopyxis sp.]|nr:hypothetical protein [Sphingopyxis sp.]
MRQAGQIEPGLRTDGSRTPSQWFRLSRSSHQPADVSRIVGAVDRQAALLVKHPPGCAAQLLVDTQRKVGRKDDAGQIDAQALRV